jgi:epoxide hydrolase-like predicted phosphatase
MVDLTGIKNIIFDLGAVIINIDFQCTFEAFSKRCNTDILTIIKRFRDLRVFERYETGELNDEQFRDFIRKEFNGDLTNAEIDHSWNALLLDIPTERIELLKKLSKTYRLFLLSNTNPIHIVEVNSILFKTSQLRTLDLLFEKVYYSYEIGMAKPDVKIYEHVLKENKLKPSETLFIDDNLDNIKGAEKAGVRTLHIVAPQSITDHLPDGRE